MGIETLASIGEVKRIASSYGVNLEGDSAGAMVQAIRSASTEVNDKMDAGQIPKTPVTERERQLLERIPTSLEHPGCSINYAVNIGIGSAYKQWIDFLENQGEPRDSVRLQSIVSPK